MTTCPECNGTGEVTTDRGPEEAADIEECDVCKGAGHIEDDGEEATQRESEETASQRSRTQWRPRQTT